MSPTSSPDQVTTVFESGNWDAENRGASLPGCEPLLATPMGNTQPPYLMTEPFESGTLRLMLHMANLYIKEHRILVLAIPFTIHRQHMVSGSADKSIQVWDPLPYVSNPPPPCEPIQGGFDGLSDPERWVGGSEGGLLY